MITIRYQVNDRQLMTLTNLANVAFRTKDVHFSNALSPCDCNQLTGQVYL